jgi:protein involved in polysaccharide export with SLBB domain
MLETKMEISTKFMAPLALIGCLTMVAACSTVSTKEGTEHWDEVSAMGKTSPQLAENEGRLSARCGAANAAREFSNATAVEDRTVYRIQRGDKLHLAFYRNGELDRYVEVRPDGRFTIEPYGDVAVAGFTPAQLAQKLDVVFSEDLFEPNATVSVIDSPFRKVFVGGQVNFPGMLPLKPAMTATQAIISTGWFKDDARADQIVLIRRDACGDAYGTFIQVANAVSQSTDHRVQDVSLLPNDIIVVPRSAVGNLDLFIKQYVRDALPIQPYLSVGPPF